MILQCRQWKRPEDEFFQIPKPEAGTLERAVPKGQAGTFYPELLAEYKSGNDLSNKLSLLLSPGTHQRWLW
jgi:hypothetical protein